MTPLELLNTFQVFGFEILTEGDGFPTSSDTFQVTLAAEFIE